MDTKWLDDEVVLSVEDYTPVIRTYIKSRFTIKLRFFGRPELIPIRATKSTEWDLMQ